MFLLLTTNFKQKWGDSLLLFGAIREKYTKNVKTNNSKTNCTIEIYHIHSRMLSFI